MASVYRIKGAGGVVIESNTFLELPKAPQKITNGVQREGMIRYNKGWEAFEGAITFDDNSIAYRRFAMLDSNGRLLTSQLPDSITSGMDYVGTYSPLEDDIDPPMTPGVYTPLPMASTANQGDYYIVRGIMDAAQAHFTANNPSTSTVIFTPSNPSGQGDWLEIKYYVDTNPTTPGTKMVNAAFGRILLPIPSGHDGLASLATDPDLTDAFNSSSNAANEKALTDGDWVIMSTTKVQRLRTNRVSILASSVMYDNSILNGSGRGISSNGGTVQTLLDTILLDGLRRTGDSMLDDGRVGGGRLGIIYGSAAEPSVAFNNGQYSPVNNPGTDPTKWTDTSTGIFHPGIGQIGFSTSGTERIRITPMGLIVIEPSNINVANNGAIQFQGSGNTVANPSVSAIQDIMSFAVKGKVQVEMKDANTVFHGDVNIDNNLNVTGNEFINGNLQVKGNTILGDTNTDTVVVNANATFQDNTAFNGNSNRFKNINVMQNGILTFEGTNSTKISQLTSDLKLEMSSFADVSIYDGATIRTRFNRYGVQLPVLNPIDNSVGVDGMIAYSTQRNTVMQKTNGQWTTVSGGGVEQSFLSSDWVLNGAYYTLTVTSANIQAIQVQELVGSNYNQVEVDSVVISSTNAIVSIPSTPDVRFTGRLIITYR